MQQLRRIALVCGTLLLLWCLLLPSLSPGRDAPNDPLAEPWKRELLLEEKFQSPYNFYAYHELRAGKPTNCSWLMYRTRRRAGDIRVRPAMSRQIARGEKGWWGIDKPSIQGGAMGFYTFQASRPLGHVVYYLSDKTILHASSEAGRVTRTKVTRFWKSPSRIRTPSTGK